MGLTDYKNLSEQVTHAIWVPTDLRRQTQQVI